MREHAGSPPLMLRASPQRGAIPTEASARDRAANYSEAFSPMTLNQATKLRTPQKNPSLTLRVMKEALASKQTGEPHA